MTIAIIGGTGLYQLGVDTQTLKVSTPSEEIEIDQLLMKDAPQAVYFLPRHGRNHDIPPHRISYRNNLYALHKLGVTHILATCAVGSMNSEMEPGDLVVLSDFIDFTHHRSFTFYDGTLTDFEGVVHTDMHNPYCPELRRLIINELEMSVAVCHHQGIYVATEGPRFETAAEIKMFKQIGGDVVGMTNVPEVLLARELKMCYMTVGIVTNWCTGIDKEEIRKEDIMQLLATKKLMVANALMKISVSKLDQDHCQCQHAVLAMSKK